MHEKHHKRLKKHVWKLWYWMVSIMDKSSEATFMNYGYAGENPPVLKKEDEGERFPLQLYHHLATKADLKDKQVLEVGCGRGGGSSYIARYLKPAKYTGIDLSGRAIRYCQTKYRVPNLVHMQGDAQNLPFEAESLDFVVNVESSHCYPDISRFFDEVYRVLKPGGTFLYTDLRNKGNVAFLKEKLAATAFQVQSYEDITPNVIEALILDSERREELVTRIVPKFLLETGLTFAGTKNSKTFKHFESGWYEYYLYVLKKA